MHNIKQGQWKISCIQAHKQKRTLLPSVVLFRDFQESNTSNAETTKKYYNQHSKDLPSLSPNMTVRVRHNNNWSRKGKIISKCEQPRSYNMLTEKGTTLSRNRRRLLKTDEQFKVEPEIDYDNIDVRSTQQESQVGTEPSCTSSNNIQRSSVTLARSQPANTLSEQGQQSKSSSCYRMRSGRSVKPPSALMSMNHEHCLVSSM